VPSEIKRFHLALPVKAVCARRHVSHFIERMSRQLISPKLHDEREYPENRTVFIKKRSRPVRLFKV
jgi:hypothetical protein